MNAVLPPEAIDTGAEGAGERIETAPGEKNSVALSLAEKVTVSPCTAETEGWLGARTPFSMEIVITVFAMAETLLQFPGFVQRGVCLCLVQRRFESWIRA